MVKVKKKLTAAQKSAKKRAKKERQKKYMWVFMNGKQVRVKRPQTIDGVDIDDYIQQNADPIWLHQNEMWDLIDTEASMWEHTDIKEANENNQPDHEDLPF